MAHGYHTLQNWNQWLGQQFLGQELLQVEYKLLQSILKKHFGKFAVLIGVPNQEELLSTTHIPYQSLISALPIHQNKVHCIEGNYKDLPFIAGSIDLVILPHTLEFVDNPRHLLSEACRIVKPEGLIVIYGFNLYSFWGLRKLFGKKNKKIPPSTNHIPVHLLKAWLQLSDFALEDYKSALFRPPISMAGLYKKLHFMEYFGLWCFPKFGGIHMLSARAKVIPLTPIKMKWKQHLSGIRISSTLPGNIA